MKTFWFGLVGFLPVIHLGLALGWGWSKSLCVRYSVTLFLFLLGPWFVDRWGEGPTPRIMLHIGRGIEATEVTKLFRRL